MVSSQWQNSTASLIREALAKVIFRVASSGNLTTEETSKGDEGFYQSLLTDAAESRNDQARDFTREPVGIGLMSMSVAPTLTPPHAHRTIVL